MPEPPPALKPLNVHFRLRTVVCHNQLDRPLDRGSEPYLLTLFFKVDGTNAALSNEFKLQTFPGAEITFPTPGTHGNLGDVDVRDGDVVAIPPAIGFFDTTLRGIQLPEPCDKLLPGGVAGVIGVVCALLEHDGVRDSAAEAAHQAFNEIVTTKITEIANTVSIENPEPQIDQEAIADEVRKAMRKAIFGELGVFGDVSIVLRSILFGAGDDNLLEAPPGSEETGTFQFTHAEIHESGAVPPFSARPNPGKANDWEITGTLEVAESCLTSTVFRLARRGEPSADLDRLREFRDADVLPRSRVAEWLALAGRNGPAIAAALRADEKLRAAAVAALAAAAVALDARAKPIPREHLATLDNVLRAALADAPRPVRHDLLRLQEGAAMLADRSPDEALEALDARRPFPRDISSGRK